MPKRPNRLKLRTLDSTSRALATLQPAVRMLGRESDPGQIARRKVYHSSRWVYRIRPAKLRRDPLCQCCKAAGRVTAATEVDHLVPLSQGGDAWAQSNLCSLCKPCHSRKTQCEQSGQAFDPVAPSAPWEYVIA